jgi:hypothetical protein
VRVAREGLEVADAVIARTGAEHFVVFRRERSERRVTAGAAAADHKPLRVERRNVVARDCGCREPGTVRADFLVELRGFEPLTSAVRHPPLPVSAFTVSCGDR